MSEIATCWYLQNLYRLENTTRYNTIPCVNISYFNSRIYLSLLYLANPFYISVNKKFVILPYISWYSSEQNTLLHCLIDSYDPRYQIKQKSLLGCLVTLSSLFGTELISHYFNIGYLQIVLESKQRYLQIYVRLSFFPHNK